MNITNGRVEYNVKTNDKQNPQELPSVYNIK